MATRNKRIQLSVIIGIVIMILAVFIFRSETNNEPQVIDPVYFDHSDYPVRVLEVAEIEDDIIIEPDVWITMRDGTRLSANIYRPDQPGTYPVVMAFTAYDKNRGPDGYPPHLSNAVKPEFDLGTFAVSPWTTWEAPDPAFWVPNGYAVVYVDSRGFFSSEGEAGILSAQDAADFYDAIEWAGTQEWSNGHVGLNGVSYLAISQWVAAGSNPPHLKAIIPWEGQSDSMREVLYHGGIPETAFTNFWQNRMRNGANTSPVPPEPIFAFAHNYPRLIRFVQGPQSIHLDQITVPALIAATWSDQGLHTRGSFEGYKNIASEQKWLFTHGRQKWAVYYSDEALAMQKMFFDHFLKGMDNRMDDVPSVRLEIRESLDVYQVRFEEAWPIARTDYQTLYLDGATNTLQETVPATTTFVQYEPFSESATFTITFDEYIELTGNMKLKLWVSTSKGSDMDLFVGVRKLDIQGEEVYFYGKAGYKQAPVALGWLRVSERELDEERSTPWQPVLTHERARKISRNEIVSVEIEILPSSTLFRAGESLQLVIQGKDLFEHPALAHTNSVNKGLHSIHTGGQYDSHLLIPVIP